MSFKHVATGDKFQPSARKENATADLLNDLQLPSGLDSVKKSRFSIHSNFKVAYDEAKKKFAVGSGFLLRNDDFQKIEPKEDLSFETENGKQYFLCITCDIDIEKEFNWTEVEYKLLEQPDAKSYPLALVEVDKDGAVSVTQFIVNVAIIIIAQQCSIMRSFFE